jgi:predicted component of type VI protein secretion system
MIVIRSQQLEAFATKRANAFVDELIGEAPTTLAGDSARSVVVAGMAAAIARGFRTPAGIRGFVRRLFVLGTAYYEHAAVRDWIDEFGLSEEERLAFVDAHADEICATKNTMPRH